MNITAQEFQLRRKKLAEQLPENGIILIPAAQEQLRNGDSHYLFRQDSNFYYLTGFKEPEALLVIINTPKPKSILFNRECNPTAEQWTGQRLGQTAALEKLYMDEAFSINKIDKELPKLLAGKEAIYYAIGRNKDLENLIISIISNLKMQARKGVKAPRVLCDIEPIIEEMRLFKSVAEINLMRHVANISVAAHKRAMQTCSKLEFEYQLAAELVYELTRNGCQSMSYHPIVGSGNNSCILHYADNNQALRPGELVLVDAGGEYENYASDITRTFPVNGKFSVEQKYIYDLVLKAQREAIAIIKPGIAWNTIQEEIIAILTQGLCDLGILKGNVKELITKAAYKPFYMHNFGHWLGLDVHDVGAYKINGAWRILQPGMVLTIEPGLYISPGMQEVDKRWWGIGVRIEDDLLVTQTGNEVLTSELPVNIDDIEALMRG